MNEFDLYMILGLALTEFDLYMILGLALQVLFFFAAQIFADKL
jgi:hypothetical protein